MVVPTLKIQEYWESKFDFTIKKTLNLNSILFSMKSILQKPFLLFILLVVVVALPLCIFPINLFSGEIIEMKGITEYKVQAPLSLSYFFGLGYQEEEMATFKDFYLLPAGYLTAFIFIIGFPGLIAYRVYLSNSKEK